MSWNCSGHFPDMPLNISGHVLYISRNFRFPGFLSESSPDFSRTFPGQFPDISWTCFGICLDIGWNILKISCGGLGDFGGVEMDLFLSFCNSHVEDLRLSSHQKIRPVVAFVVVKIVGFIVRTRSPMSWMLTKIGGMSAYKPPGAF